MINKLKLKNIEINKLKLKNIEKNFITNIHIYKVKIIKKR